MEKRLSAMQTPVTDIVTVLHKFKSLTPRSSTFLSGKFKRCKRIDCANPNKQITSARFILIYLFKNTK